MKGNGVATNDSMLNVVVAKGLHQFFEAGKHPARLPSWRKLRGKVRILHPSAQGWTALPISIFLSLPCVEIDKNTDCFVYVSL